MRASAGVVPQARASLIAPVAFAIVGISIMVLRSFDSPIGVWLAQHVSFHRLPSHSQNHVDDLLLVPAAAVLVVLCRVTIGLRMLGPFRPVLIALAFYQTGVLAGALFLACVMWVVVRLRPRLERGMLPYFGRLSLLLCAVVIVELVALMLGESLHLDRLIDAAVFPIVVLCLSADGFARVLADDGRTTAIWRGSVTVGLAAVISMVGNLDAVAEFLFDFPEFVLVEVALILVISTRMRWGLLERRKSSVAAGEGA